MGMRKFNEKTEWVNLGRQPSPCIGRGLALGSAGCARFHQLRHRVDAVLGVVRRAHRDDAIAQPPPGFEQNIRARARPEEQTQRESVITDVVTGRRVKAGLHKTRDDDVARGLRVRWQEALEPV